MPTLAPIPALILILVLNISAQEVRYVRGNSSSFQECPGQPCLTLDQYTRDSGLYFTTGATFVFLAGDHVPLTIVHLRNISNLTLIGNQVSNFICKNHVAFLCSNVTNLKIENLRFVLNSGICFVIVNSRSVQLFNSTFKGTTSGVWTKAIHSGRSNITIVSCLFKGNTGDDGGAISVTDRSTVGLNGNTFIGNRAAYSGGAIYAHNSSIILIETLGNVFTNNSAGIGGALDCQNCNIEVLPDSYPEASISCVGDIITTLQPRRVVFSYNTATHAGAIAFHNSTAALGGSM